MGEPPDHDPDTEEMTVPMKSSLKTYNYQVVKRGAIKKI